MHRLHTHKRTKQYYYGITATLQYQMPFSLLGWGRVQEPLAFYAYGSFIALKINSALTAAVSPFKLPRLEKVCTVCTHTNAHYSLSYN